LFVTLFCPAEERFRIHLPAGRQQKNEASGTIEKPEIQPVAIFDSTKAGHVDHIQPE
jgi:hypothetical protein